MIKNLFSLFGVLIISGGVLVAQSETETESIWFLSIDSAKSKAQVENKNILIAFTGSDWCANCIKLEKEILNNEVFISFSEKKLVMVRADFPRRKKNLLSKQQTEHNEELAARYNPSGQFPTIALVNNQGKLIKTTGYLPILPEHYVEHIESLLP